MNRLKIINSSTWTPSVVVSSHLHPMARISGLNRNPQEISVTPVKPMTARVSLDRPASTQRLRTGSRPSLWTRVGGTLAVEGMAAARAPTGKPQAVAAHAQDLADTAAAPAPAKPPPAIAKVELTINSLGSYELNKPIPVFVEILGEPAFCRGSAGLEHFYVRQQPERYPDCAERPGHANLRHAALEKNLGHGAGATAQDPGDVYRQDEAGLARPALTRGRGRRA